MFKSIVIFLLGSLVALPSQAIDVFFEKDTTLPLVDINLAIKGGSVTDPKDLLGITNLMGDLLLRGTKSRTKQQIDLELDQQGSQLAIETRPEAIVVRGSTLKDQLPRFLSLVQEILTSPSFPESELSKLKSETISTTLQILASDESLARIHFNEFLFGNHPYARPSIGYPKTLKKIDRQSAIRQYEQLFRQDHMILVGTGDADPSEIKDWAKSLSLKFKKDSTLSKISTPEVKKGRRLLIVDKPDRSQIRIVGGQLGILRNDPNFYALTLANQAYGGGSFSARMMVEIRVKKGWSYGAGSGFSYGLAPRSWSYSFFPKAVYGAEAMGYSLKMVQDLKNQGLTEKEFNFAKESTLNSAGFAYNTPAKRVENRLTEKIYGLPDRFFENLENEIKNVTLVQANQAMASFLDSKNFTVVVVGTASKIKSDLIKSATPPFDEVLVKPFDQDFK
jgi:zinc protease